MSAYYNEIDPYCVAWLSNLIAAGHLPPGDIDERSIEQVHADDLKGYTQAHFFAGIGGWAHAARLAGWPDDRPLWTGSCPCPPFSNAGKRKICPECGWANPVPCPARTGYFLCCECEHQWHADDRHLWPEFWRLIRDRRPPVVAGEQVASADGRVWLAGVRGSLEILGYAVGASDLCAAGVSAPHLRHRLWWVADHDGEGRGEQLGSELLDGQRSPPGNDADGCGEIRGLDHAIEPGLERHPGHGADGHKPGRLDADAPGSTAAAGGDRGIPDSAVVESPGRNEEAGRRASLQPERHLNSPWSDAIWIPCGDGKARRIEPGIEPLVDGFPGRVDQVRAYGNAIVPQEAAEVLIAFDEARRQRGGGMNRPPYRCLEERLLFNSVYNPETGCREWIGGFNSKRYPRLSIRKKGLRHPVPVYAHRLAWELRNEQKIPPGMTIDHTCCNTACIEPDHLELVTRVENTIRRNQRAYERERAEQLGEVEAL